MLVLGLHSKDRKSARDKASMGNQCNYLSLSLIPASGTQVPILSPKNPSPIYTTHRTFHYNDVIMGAMESQIASLTIVYSTIYPGADQRKYQSSASLAFLLGIHRWPVNSPHKCPITRKIFPFDDVIVLRAIMATAVTNLTVWNFNMLNK